MQIHHYCSHHYSNGFCLLVEGGNSLLWWVCPHDVFALILSHWDVEMVVIMMINDHQEAML
jgi:hypothetical protein